MNNVESPEVFLLPGFQTAFFFHLISIPRRVFIVIFYQYKSHKNCSQLPVEHILAACYSTKTNILIMENPSEWFEHIFLFLKNSFNLLLYAKIS